MYLALATVSFHAKRAGTGGSYGYGKSGLIRGSAVRTVVAYTCFREREDDPSVTRRLLGMVYWGQHHRGHASFTGFGRFGHEQDPDTIVPFENEKADEIAAGLGIPVRDPEFPEQLGTTFLLIDPIVRPPDLVKAIECSWWPALESGADFHAVVETVEGRESCPRPRKDDVLATFLDAYEVATAPPDNRRPDRKQVVFRAMERFSTPGVLGLVADPAGWSYPEQTEPSGNEVIEHRSLVALVRKPRMVVEYYEAGHAAPYVRGVFIADGSVDEALRATEPKAHDAWQTTASESDDIAPADTRCAKQIISRIRTAVADFRRQLKPERHRHADYVLPAFDRAMRKLIAGPARPRPVPEPRPVSIHPDWKLTPVGADSLKVSGSVSFSLTDHVPDGEQREAEAAPLLHDALSVVDVEVLDDPGFWRYLSLGLFWDFIRWRETKAFARGNYLRYVDGKSSNECVLTRMYLRGAAVGGLPFAEYASMLPKATDFWRSHVVRVRTGTAPSLVRALVDMQRQHRLPTDPLRQFAEDLNRTWSNVVLSIYDDDEAHALVEKIQRQASSEGSSV